MDSLRTGLGKNTITDEQYVEFTRRWMRVFKWFSPFVFCLAALCLYMFLFIVVRHGLDSFAAAHGATLGSLVIGLWWGLLAGLMMCGLLESMTKAGRCMARHRTERLMLKLHEEKKAQ